MSGAATFPAASRIARRLALGCLPALLACAGTPPASLGLVDQRLAPCPSSPNCVVSDGDDEQHAVAPLAFVGPPAVAWGAARAAVASLPRTKIVVQTDDYLHAECTSALFRFVDDLELQLRADAGVIAVRSASRVGHSDLGVNRRRVETLRQRFADAMR